MPTNLPRFSRIIFGHSSGLCLPASFLLIILTILRSHGSHNVGKDAGSGYVGSCAIALYEHGVLAVALGGQQYHIV